MNHESKRLAEHYQGKNTWLQFGPYLTDRQWGTVREDYSPYGNAWEFISHDMARSKAYRWGEDGLGGISDDLQLLCFSWAFWNQKDPILKERLFGLTGNEGNHGEDVKEYYYYLDSTPTHSYMKMLYKYPQEMFPYERLVSENRNRGKQDPEFELMDTGVFDNNRYFDIFIEYAKNQPGDILIKITACNRGDREAPLHVIPQLWFRNTWSWGHDEYKPHLSYRGQNTIAIQHQKLGDYHLYFQGSPRVLVCGNETNSSKLYGFPDQKGFHKDALHEYIINGNNAAVNPAGVGTKAGIEYVLKIPAGDEQSVTLRLSQKPLLNPFSDFDSIWRQRRQQADEFYTALQENLESGDEKNVQRQALAGMLWSKQFYYFDIPQWLQGDPGRPSPPDSRKTGRNFQWTHLNNADIISMPDKWEYPWFAAWDLAFHCIPLALVDAQFAKNQLLLLTKEWYMHPNGQLPAYEWQFGDVNPPVHAWAAWRVYKIDKKRNGKGDLAFLEAVYHKLLLNFTWWVNRKDAEGRNIFQGGFLGLDNIGVFDRSAQLPTGGYIEQADGTGWMAMYSLNLMRIALELAQTNPVYQDLATKFFEHFLYIAEAMNNCGGTGISLWNHEDEFYYDVLSTPDHRKTSMKVRSMVGLIPLFAVEVLDHDLLKSVPEFAARMDWFLSYRPDLADLVSRWHLPGEGKRHLLSLLRGHRLKMILRRMLDQQEFLSEYGIRALSRYHLDNPYIFNANGHSFLVRYQPGESDSGLFGGNSNWRGPIWFPVNYLIIESLQRFHHYFGDDFKVEYPTGSGTFLTLLDISNELSDRLKKIFLKEEKGRAVFGTNEKFQKDPHFMDYLLFHEYFHGDTGRGVGASHQTGWTGLIAKLIHPRSEEVKPATKTSSKKKIKEKVS